MSPHTAPRDPSGTGELNHVLCGVAVRAIALLDQLEARPFDPQRDRELLEQTLLVVAEQQETERRRIRAQLHERLAEIESAERVLVTYFNHVFPERRDALNWLFTELDRAREAGQTDGMAASIQGILDVATTSPLKGVFDLEQVRRELAARKVEL